MKKLFLTLIVTVVTINAFSQWLPAGATTGNINYNNGYVGIGISTPSYPLTVYKDLGVVSGEHIVSGFGRTSVNIVIGYKSDGTAVTSSFLRAANSLPLFFGTTTSPQAISILDNGKIGIGIATPKNMLDVEGGAVIGATYSGTNSAPTNGLLVEGNLLIGKTTQTNAIYKLDVAGSIRANEVVVNTSGADFVFAPNYKLRSLGEVECFIKENNHLPEIPSATRMQQDGLNVSEMQTKLLQKVEELTLYIIELKKQNDNLQQQVNDLKK